MCAFNRRITCAHVCSQAYAEANSLLGNIVKVTPSSKVCGDLALFMVQNNLTEADVRAKASSLNFPKDVVR